MLVKLFTGALVVGLFGLACVMAMAIAGGVGVVVVIFATSALLFNVFVSRVP